LVNIESLLNQYLEQFKHIYFFLNSLNDVFVNIKWW